MLLLVYNPSSLFFLLWFPFLYLLYLFLRFFSGAIDIVLVLAVVPDRYHARISQYLLQLEGDMGHLDQDETLPVMDWLHTVYPGHEAPSIEEAGGVWNHVRKRILCDLRALLRVRGTPPVSSLQVPVYFMKFTLTCAIPMTLYTIHHYDSSLGSYDALYQRRFHGGIQPAVLRKRTQP